MQIKIFTDGNYCWLLGPDGKTKYYLIREDLYEKLTGDLQTENAFKFKYFY